MSSLGRKSVSYQAKHQIFLQKEKNYIQQYSHLYLKRLLSIRPKLLEIVSKKYPEVPIVGRVIALKAGDRVCVIGTVYKEQKLKPSVLDEFTGDFGSNIREKLSNYCGPDDFLLLEDESGRCFLQGDASFTEQVVPQLITGVVIACIGVLDDAGRLIVSQIIYPGETETIPPQLIHSETPSEFASRYLLLTSGLAAGSVADNHSLSLQLIIDYVNGVLNPETGSNICRVVVAGGSLMSPHLPTHVDSRIHAEAQEMMVEPLRVADRFLAELASSAPLDVMPGEMDPCNTSLPQQPLHPCLFPSASRLTSFKCVSNPYSFILNGSLMIGHSGQPVKDILRYIKPGMSELNVLEKCYLQFRHLAPTAPDTLACYPFFDRDPFVIDNDEVKLVFSGNSSSFQTSFNDGTRFVCIPNFFETKQVVLIDLDSSELAAKTVSFAIED